MAPRQKATIEQCAEALRLNMGFISKAANAVNITAGAMSKKIKRSKVLQKILADILEQQLDFSESILFKNMKQTENLSVAQKAVEFHLRYKGKDRGYIESQRHILEGGDRPVAVKLIVEEIKADTENEDDAGND